jgi:hypothetical protein
MTKILIDEAVVRQALECLDGVWRGDYNGNAEKTAAVLRKALSDAALDALLDKMADNARELGLGYDASVAQIDTSAERVEKSAENKHMPAPAQQPVATVIQFDGEKIIDASMEFFDKYPIGTELYATPPAPAQPLTRQQVNDLLFEAGYVKAEECADFINGIRHAEAAHGITKGNT